MAYIDKKIAMLERQVRLQEKDATEKEKQREQSMENQLTLEEVLEAVREGVVIFPNKEKYDFTVRTVMSEQIPALFIKGIYTGVKEEDAVAIYVDHDRGISQCFTMADVPITKGSIGEWKKLFQDGMRKMKVYEEVLCEKVLDNLDYIIYRTPAGSEWIYNVAFRIRKGSGRVFGTYNCYEKNKDTYGIMLEALVIRLNELLSEDVKVS